MQFNELAQKIPSSLDEAKAIQNQLRREVRTSDDFAPVKIIAGLDVGYNLKTNTAKAALVCVTLDGLETLESFSVTMPVTFPYVPGYLSFRETPVIIKALSQLNYRPDMLLIDGHGIAHPRRLGIAAHIGALLDIPTIGVAKKKLCGVYADPGPDKGSHSNLYDKDEQIGIVLRSRSNVKPLYISPGHRVGMASTLKITEACLTRYRLPEPTRLADKLSKLQ
jgi:deoxyribonuclease V